MNKKGGFTLIELMVVISIIGFLAAIAIPRFANITESAKVAQIQANKRTIETALQMYMIKEDLNIIQVVNRDQREWYDDDHNYTLNGDFDYFESKYLIKNIPSLPGTNDDRMLLLGDMNTAPEFSDSQITGMRDEGFGWGLSITGEIYPLVTYDEYGIRYDEFI